MYVETTVEMQEQFEIVGRSNMYGDVREERPFYTIPHGRLDSLVAQGIVKEPSQSGSIGRRFAESCNNTRLTVDEAGKMC